MQLSRAQFPDDVGLQEALAECVIARRNNCCSDRICGYQFFGEGHPDPARRERRRFASGQILIGRPEDRGDVYIDLLEDGRVAAFEFI